MGRIINMKKADLAFAKYLHSLGLLGGTPPWGVTLSEEYGNAIKNLQIAMTKAEPIPSSPAGWARWYLNHKSGMHYAEIRPMSLPHPPEKPSHLDCSWFATLCFHSAGLPDPNGYGYNGAGNTSSLCVHGHLVPKAEPSDLVFYGWPAAPHTIEHVAVAISSNTVISMGMEGDPNERPLHDCGAGLPLIEIRRYL